jgi:hypothetical protein
MCPDAVPTELAASDPPVSPPSRRTLLAGALGALAATVATALGRPAPADAAAGSTLVIGSEANNAGSANTQLLTNSSVVAFKLLQQGPGTALMGYATPASGATRGVYGRTDSPNGFGVQGRNAGAAGSGAAVQAIGGNNIGVDASTDNNTRYAVKGVNNGVNGTAIFGDSAGGTGVYGNAPSGTGVRGVSSGGYGMYGSSSSGVGVVGGSSTYFGVAGGSSSGTGVRGSSSSGAGVWGESDSGYGVYAYSGYNAAVYGYSVNSYAGYFQGPIFATSANASIKAFRIDHPLDPAGQALMHSCVESNERKLVYDGVVTTDARGEATVELPAYFGALNRDLRYQLTVIGSFAQAIVKAKVKANRFTIATSEPGVEVCWQVSGVRQDAYATAHPLVVESAKTGREKGKYLNPLEHGQPASAGVDYELRQGLEAVPPPA